jgi:predicted methyltransferase
MRDADIAAGKGYLTKPLARKVGASGRVFAVEIGEVERAALQQLARDSFPNIEVVAGSETDPTARRSHRCRGRAQFLP